MSAVVIAIVVGVILLNVVMVIWEALGIDGPTSWTRCPHGVRGGRERQRCTICIDEARKAEQLRLRTLRILEQQKVRDASADEMRRKEYTRLAQSIVPNLKELRKLTPQKFEDEIAQMFKRLGYVVQQTPYSNDGGRDAILTKEGEKILLECKRYGESSVSGRPDLQKFHSAIVTDGAKFGFFVTSGSCSDDAIKFAGSPNVPITLIDNKQLIRKMFESKSASSEDDAYTSMCRTCGEIAHHRLRNPEIQKCPKGHDVEPTLTVDNFLDGAIAPPPLCKKCGAKMRLINGKRGPFWGCSRYPECYSSRSYEQSGRKSSSRGWKRRRSR